MNDLALMAGHRWKVVGGLRRRDQALELVFNALHKRRTRCDDGGQVRVVRHSRLGGISAKRLGQSVISKRQLAVVVAFERIVEQGGFGGSIRPKHVAAQAALVAEHLFASTAARACDGRLALTRCFGTALADMTRGLASVFTIAPRVVANAITRLAIDLCAQTGISHQVCCKMHRCCRYRPWAPGSHGGK
jgi:transposase InsO family protein